MPRSIILTLLAITACSPARHSVSRDDRALTERASLILLAGVPFTGELITKNAAGRVVRSEMLRDGRLDGTVNSWYDDGRAAETREYVRGAKNGVHHGWWENGRPKFACAFDTGLPSGECREWYDNGTLAMIHRFHGGVEAGLQQGWSVRGEPQFSYVMRDGRRYGLLGALNCKTGVRTEGAL